MARALLINIVTYRLYFLDYNYVVNSSFAKGRLKGVIYAALALCFADLCWPGRLD